MEQNKENVWIDVKEHPLQFGVEVIGYNPAWIDDDFNPNGTRIGFLSDYGDDNKDGVNVVNDGKITGVRHFCQAKWIDTHDTYITLYGESDDPEDNMPTHYMLIPKHP